MKDLKYEFISRALIYLFILLFIYLFILFHSYDLFQLMIYLFDFYYYIGFENNGRTGYLMGFIRTVCAPVELRVSVGGYIGSVMLCSRA